jgi:hypothetical protein
MIGPGQPTSAAMKGPVLAESAVTLGGTPLAKSYANPTIASSLFYHVFPASGAGGGMTSSTLT